MSVVTPLFTGSAIDRLMTCLTSGVLQHVLEEDNAYSTEGSTFHRFRQRSREIGKEAALAELDEDERAACERLPEMSAYTEFAAEVAFAFDPATGQARELARGLPRLEAYKLCRPGEIPCTLDAVGLADGHVHVLEEKYGYKAEASLYTWQTKFGALCAARAWRREHAIIDLACQRPDQVPNITRSEMDAFDLGAAAVEVTLLVQRLKALDPAKGPLVKSPHCRYCPASYTCPANLTAIDRLRAGGDGIRVTAQTAAEAYAFVQSAKDAIGIMEKQLRSLAMSEPIPLGDGRYYGPVAKRGRATIDGEAAFQALVALRGREFALAASTHKVTQTGIAKAVREADPALKVEPQKRDIMAQLEEAGCVSRNPYTSVTEYDAASCRTEGCPWQAMTPGGTCRLCAVEVGQ